MDGLEILLLGKGTLGFGPLVKSGFLASFIFFLRFLAKLLFSLVIARPRWGGPLVELGPGTYMPGLVKLLLARQVGVS